MDKNIIYIFVGFLDPTKINAVKKAFDDLFITKKVIVKGKGAQSGVVDQPMSEQETKKGALNRLYYLKKIFC